jgi:hypothetical protein
MPSINAAGLAIKIDEYVPKKTPNKSTSEKL